MITKKRTTEYSTPVEYSTCVNTVPKNSNFSSKNLYFLEICHQIGSEWVWEVQNVLEVIWNIFDNKKNKNHHIRGTFWLPQRAVFALVGWTLLKMMKCCQKRRNNRKFTIPGLTLGLGSPRYFWDVFGILFESFGTVQSLRNCHCRKRSWKNHYNK